MIRRARLHREEHGFDDKVTFGSWFFPYEMQKDFYLDELTNAPEGSPEDRYLGKQVVERLDISIEEVTVESFTDEDNKGIWIRFKIKGEPEDIEQLNVVLEARRAD